MTPLIVEAEKALSDLAIFKAAESQRVALEVELARMRAKRIEDIVADPWRNQGVVQKFPNGRF